MRRIMSSSAGVLSEHLITSHPDIEGPINEASPGQRTLTLALSHQQQRFVSSDVERGRPQLTRFHPGSSRTLCVRTFQRTDLHFNVSTPPRSTLSLGSGLTERLGALVCKWIGTRSPTWLIHSSGVKMTWTPDGTRFDFLFFLAMVTLRLVASTRDKYP